MLLFGLPINDKEYVYTYVYIYINYFLLNNKFCMFVYLLYSAQVQLMEIINEALSHIS